LIKLIKTHTIIMVLTPLSSARRMVGTTRTWIILLRPSVEGFVDRPADHVGKPFVVTAACMKIVRYMTITAKVTGQKTAQPAVEYFGTNP